MIALSLSSLLLLQRCAPDVDPRAMTALVAMRSGWTATRLADLTQQRAFTPPAASAPAVLHALLRRGDDVQVGYAALDSQVLQRVDGVDPAVALDPCVNINLADRALVRDTLAADRAGIRADQRWPAALDAFLNVNGGHVGDVPAIVSLAADVVLPLPGRPDLAPPKGGTR